MMDRLNFRGPKWEGIGIPKSIIEEENPIYKPAPEGVHPSMDPNAVEGQKEFETVVR
jgi:hypothetical protein